MVIDENTKIIGRFHSTVSPRGLNIYNPLFQDIGVNALYVLFHDPDPKTLFDGMRKLNLAGAVTAGFEKDLRLFKLVDGFDDMSRYLKKVGYVKNINGKLIASYQGGEGMYRTIKKVSELKNKKLVIVGAGQVTRALLFIIKKSKDFPKEVEIYNRTLKNAQDLKKEYKFVKKVGTLADLQMAKGDILVNLSKIGGSEKDTIFDNKLIDKFNTIVDVSFETEKTNLIKLAIKLKKKYSTGWDMFTYQGQVLLENILDTKIPSDLLRKYVVKGLTNIVK